MFSIQLSRPEACIVGVTGLKVCVSTHGGSAATWLLVFAVETEMRKFLAFAAKKGIHAARAELYFAPPRAMPAGSALEELLKKTDSWPSILKDFVATPGWEKFVDEIERIASHEGMQLAAGGAPV